MEQESSSINISTVDIKKYIFEVISNWYLFVISIPLAWLGVFFMNKFTSDQYSVKTTMMVTSESRQAENIIGGLSLFPTTPDLQGQTTILKSFSFHKKTIEELDFKISYFTDDPFVDVELYKKTPFKVITDTINPLPQWLKIYIQIIDNQEFRIYQIGKQDVDLIGKFGQPFNQSNLTFTVEKTIKFSDAVYNGLYYFYVNDLNVLAKIYASKLNAYPLTSNSAILELASTGTVAQKEVDYLNKLVDVYIQNSLEEKNTMATNIISFIDNQLRIITDSLTISQDDLIEFRLENKVLDIKDQGSSLFQQLNDKIYKKNVLVFQKNYYKSLLVELADNKDIRSFMPPAIIGIENQILNEYLKQLIDLKEEKSILKYSVKEDIPKIQVLDRKIEKAKENLIMNINHNIEAVDYLLNQLNQELDQTTREIQRLPVTERKMSNLTRQYNLNDNFYTYLLQRKSEAEISKVSNKPDVKVIDPALIENSVLQSGSKTKYSTGIFIGFLIPIIIIIIKEFFNTTIRDKHDIENRIKVPIIGALSHSDFNVRIPVVDNSRSQLAESFRSLRTNIQYMLIDDAKKIISVTSTISGEGKSFCSINLAGIIALSNKKTLLVGLDLRKPKIHKVFNIDNLKGISSYLINKHTFDEIITPTDNENLFVAVSGPIPPNPAELIETRRMTEFFEEAEKKFDYIIIDTPPVALVTDAILISKFSSVTVYVIRQGYSNKNVLKLINELHSNSSMKNMSVIINDVRYSRGYGYKYGYRYSYGYGYGYDNEAYFGEIPKES